MKRIFLLMLSALISLTAVAQVTTSGLSGLVTDESNQPLIGATVIAVHTPSGTQYGTVTNATGRFNMQGMRAGGPYTVTYSYVGYQTVEFPGVELQLGETQTRNAYLKDSQTLEAIVVTGQAGESPMSINRSGAVTSVSREQIEMMPTVSRSMNDIIKLTPQAASTSNGMAIGGGNYRQSYVTVDGAAFNNMFGIGGNLPAGGSPISLDALEQIAISVTPYDVRQSGFTGGAINAVTKSGTNEIKVSVYDYFENDALIGNKVNGEEFPLQESMTNTVGFSIGAPIIKDKLFIFTNFEYESNTVPGQSRLARPDENTAWGYGEDGAYNRPTVDYMETVKGFLADEFGYDPGRYQNYSIDIPTWKLMARVDWNINDNHSMNVRFSKTMNKYTASPSSSVSPLYDPGYNRYSGGRTGDNALYFESARYYQEQNFTSVAAELNSRFLDGRLNNSLRFTYSKQYEPRSYEGNLFPTVDILDEGEVATTFGLDPFTYGNLREVSSYIVTDEVSYSTGIHNLIGGFSFEFINTKNGFMQGGAGYYVYDSWETFVGDVQDPTNPAYSPLAFAITHPNNDALSQEFPQFNYMQYSLYLQDEITFSDRFKATVGLRLEMPTFPSLDNNENKEFTELMTTYGLPYKTSDMPDARLQVSPRVGFNWDLTGERKYVLRGGTGIFTGRIPFVWLVSAVGNSNCLQNQVIYNEGEVPSSLGFHPDLNGILSDLHGGTFTQQDLPAPTSPTIIDKDLKMPSTWKSSLAFNAKLPGDINLNIEGIYNQNINDVMVKNASYINEGKTIQLPGEPVARTQWSSLGIKNSAGSWVNAYNLTNSEENGYYASITAQATKNFDFGLSLMAAYTYSHSKSISDGIGDQVSSAFYTNTYTVNGSNFSELGYSSYVSPNRLMASIGFSRNYGKNFGTSVSLFYEGYNHGYVGGYSYTRYSYVMDGNVTGERGADNLLYIPTATELAAMDFSDDGSYTGAQQRADFEAFIQSDDYLSENRGSYSERGGAVMPWRHVFSLKVAQDFYVNVKGKRNKITLGVDINNLGNMLNSDWGVPERLSRNDILSYDSYTGTYNFNKAEWTSYTGTASTWSALLSLRYTFN